MKYMLLIYLEENSWQSLTEAERQAVYAEYRQFSQDIASSGHYISGSELHPVSMATSVRVRNGDQLTTDGPFVGMKEAVGGMFILEADDLDAAIEVAARVPAARYGGAVEIRPSEVYW